jgi:hypothetical protein
MGRPRTRRLLVLVALALVAAAVAAPAAPGSRARSSWTSLLPARQCPHGRFRCVDRVAHALTVHVAQLGCSHDAVFAQAYVDITNAIGGAVRRPGFFDDPHYIARFDAVFASAYGRAWDAWTTGRGKLPPAWRMAFEAAAQHRVTGTGDLMLAINAHIGRDEAFALARAGLTGARGRSHKPDQDRVDSVLEAAMRPMLDQLSARYDPTIGQPNPPTSLDDVAVYQFIAGMRQRAWRLAQALVATRRNRAMRAAVSRNIELQAQQSAAAIEAATAYPPGSNAGAARDAYCAAHT